MRSELTIVSWHVHLHRRDVSISGSAWVCGSGPSRVVRHGLAPGHTPLAPTAALLCGGLLRQPDVVMPKMNGQVLAEELLRRRPAIKVVYVSGYSDDTFIRPGLVQESTHWLAKPCLASDLARKIRDVLDGSKAPS